jgi:hypothetical protein
VAEPKKVHRTGPVDIEPPASPSPAALPVATGSIPVPSGPAPVPVRAVPVPQTAPAAVQDPDDTPTQLMPRPPLPDENVTGTLHEEAARLRATAETRRAILAAELQDLREEYDGHQDRMDVIRQEQEALSRQINALSERIQPRLTEYAQLEATVKHLDATLGLLKPRDS